MANQKRLSDNLSRYEADRRGVARKGAALLQGLAVCGRCGRRMGLRYSGPHANYPVYVCTADSTQSGLPRCQEVRALPVDAEIERLLLEALQPDRIAMAIAALAAVEEEVRQLERQWSMKKERARYEAERARRQYDAVDPDNRLVARPLERQWEEKLREVEATCQRRSKSLPLGRSKTRPVWGVGVELDALRPPRRRWPGFRSRGGRGFQEAEMTSPVSGSAASAVSSEGRGSRRRLAFDCLSR